MQKFTPLPEEELQHLIRTAIGLPDEQMDRVRMALEHQVRQRKRPPTNVPGVLGITKPRR
jgi:hypothetical protein